jgi:hypothetical protein
MQKIPQNFQLQGLSSFTLRVCSDAFCKAIRQNDYLMASGWEVAEIFQRYGIVLRLGAIFVLILCGLIIPAGGSGNDLKRRVGLQVALAW